MDCALAQHMGMVWRSAGAHALHAGKDEAKHGGGVDAMLPNCPSMEKLCTAIVERNAKHSKLDTALAKKQFSTTELTKLPIVFSLTFFIESVC